jgi:hypothetical protein
MDPSDVKNVDRRALLAGMGGAVAGSLLATAARAGAPRPPSPIDATLQRILDKIARTDAGFAEPCIPVQSLPGSEVAQFIISESGSYYLTQNIVGEPGRHAIDIQADDVDLDLCGFHIVGAADPAGLAAGAGIHSDHSNVTVYDGTVIGFAVGVDFEHASRFIVWDVTSIGAVRAGFVLGSRGQAYDCDCYACFGPAFSSPGERSVVEECGAWTCAAGFSCPGTQNLLLANCATECPSPFEIAPGNSHGPIVDVTGVGDISAVPGSDHPGANFVY